MSGSDVEGLPSYFKDNPWLDILANRGQEDVADMAPLAPRASGGPAISTAPEVAQVSSSPSQLSQAPSGQDLSQLITSLVKLAQGQIQVAHAQASAQPMVVVVPIVIQMPVWPSAELGGHGGITPRLNAVSYEEEVPGSNPGRPTIPTLPSQRPRLCIRPW